MTWKRIQFKLSHEDKRNHSHDPENESTIIYEDEDSKREFLKSQIHDLLSSKKSNVWDLIDGDGHSIISAKEYLEAGFPKEYIESMSRVHKSDTSSAKSTIFDNEGNVLPEIKGVYSLSFHYDLADLLNISHNAENKHGRGSQARAIAEAIRSHYNYKET